MEYQNIINVLDNKPNQSLNIQDKTWFEINDYQYRVHSTCNQIKFKTMMLKSSFCDYSKAYILVKGTI